MYSLRPVFLSLALSAILMLVGTGPGVAGEVYKWVDSKGRTHFGDKPPDSAKSATRIDTSAATRTTQAADAEARRLKQKKLLDAYSAERKEREVERRKARLQKAELKRKCAETRRSLALLERSNLVYSQNKNGDRNYASDAQRAQLIEKFKTTLGKSC